jgi:hypothetical protein
MPNKKKQTNRLRASLSTKDLDANKKDVLLWMDSIDFSK